MLDQTIPDKYSLHPIETHIITTKFPDAKVIVLTMQTDETFSDRSHKAVARHFLAKDCGKEKLFIAIKHCSPGQ